MESRVTVTVKLQTYWGHVEERTVEVDAGIAWQDRVLTDLQPVLDDMDELCHNEYAKRSEANHG